MEDFKPLYDLCVEELKKKNKELQDNLEGKGCKRKQEVVILLAPICELEKMIAARDGEMDAIQQTVQVHVEDIMPQEDSCVLQQRDEEECVEETLQGQVEDSKEREQLFEDTNEDALDEQTRRQQIELLEAVTVSNEPKYYRDKVCMLICSLCFVLAMFGGVMYILIFF